MSTDVDECALESDNCRHMCHNKVGSFTCSCRDGYKLRNNGRGCQGSMYILHMALYRDALLHQPNVCIQI